MAFSAGITSVPNSATKICSVGSKGVLVQNLGTVIVTLGTVGVVAGQGVSLPASMTSPIFVPGQGVEGPSVIAGAVDTCDLYGIGATAGPTNVAFLTPG